MIGRRAFITLLGGAPAGWSLAASAQQSAMPVIGYLYTGSPDPSAHLTSAFRKGLSEAGYTEGRDVTIEYRWAHNDNARLPELAADLVRRQVAVLVTPGSSPAALVAKATTSTIPVIFSIGADPVEIGLVTSLNRPGGNITGFSSMNVELAPKRFGLLHELLPQAGRAFVLANSSNPVADVFIRDVRAAATAVGWQIEVLTANTVSEINTAFSSLAQKSAAAVLVTPGPLFNNRRIQLATLASRYTLPVMFSSREFAEAGGLMSYGPSIPEEFRQAGLYAARVLKGEKPADLPVGRATKFEFVINLQTANALGIEIPPTLLARADEVIE
jgi:putative tryptophan/tyrosine transport system substrate-binding protein